MIPIFPFKLPIFTLSGFFGFFMSSYGLIVMILSFCLGGDTAAIHRFHTGDAS